MKKIKPKHQSGSTLDKVVDAGGYLVPFYGTYKSYKDWGKDKTWGNALMTGVSGLGDALLLFGVGEGLKAIPAAKAAARMTKAANTFETGAKATREAAQLAKTSGNSQLVRTLESKAADYSSSAAEKAMKAQYYNDVVKSHKTAASAGVEGVFGLKVAPLYLKPNNNQKRNNLVEKRSSSLAPTYYPKFK